MAVAVKASQESKSLRIDKVYMDRRIPRLRDEIKGLNSEHATLAKKLKSTASSDTGRLFDARAEALYVKRRLGILREELKTLPDGRRAALVKLRAERKKA